MFMKFHKNVTNKVPNPHNPQALELLTKVRQVISHLRDHEFKHNFLDTNNLLCSCGSDIKTISHFFLYCSIFLEERTTLLSEISETDSKY